MPIGGSIIHFHSRILPKNSTCCISRGLDHNLFMLDYQMKITSSNPLVNQRMSTCQRLMCSLALLKLVKLLNVWTPFLKAGLGGHLSITNVLLGQGQLCARRRRKTQRKEGRESDARKKQYKTHVCITKLITWNHWILQLSRFTSWNFRVDGHWQQLTRCEMVSPIIYTCTNSLR